MKIKDNKIFFDEQKSIICPYPIQDYVIFEETIVVLLKKPMNVIYNRNVIAYNAEGQVWQVDDLFSLDNCFYNMIKLDENGLIHLYNWCGIIVKLNPRNGEVVDKIFSK